MAEAETWRLSDFAIIRRHWGDETVVYFEGSGETLLLSPFGEVVLDELAVEPCGADSLVDKVAAKVELEVDMTMHFAVKKTLALFLNYGLVRRER